MYCFQPQSPPTPCTDIANLCAKFSPRANFSADRPKPRTCAACTTPATWHRTWNKGLLIVYRRWPSAFYGLGWLINIGNTPKDTTKVCDAKRTSLVMSIHCQCFPNRTSQSSGMGSRLDSPGLSLECYFLNLFEAFGDSRCLPKEVILGCFARIFGCPGPSLAERRLASSDWRWRWPQNIDRSSCCRLPLEMFTPSTAILRSIVSER